MKYNLTKGADILKKDKFGIHLNILPNFDNAWIKKRKNLYFLILTA